MECEEPTIATEDTAHWAGSGIGASIVSMVFAEREKDEGEGDGGKNRDRSGINRKRSGG